MGWTGPGGLRAGDNSLKQFACKAGEHEVGSGCRVSAVQLLRPIGYTRVTMQAAIAVALFLSTFAGLDIL
jgi:hypothetical protein